MNLALTTFGFAFMIFYVFSKLIFDEVFTTSKTIIDEAFHIPQGLDYCSLNFSSWNPKITTLPGLYILSTVILSPFNACSVYWLRFVCFGCAICNFILLYALLNLTVEHSNWKNLLVTINLSLLPPLFFFGNLYYSDTPSITFILLMLLCYKEEKIILASVFGFFSVIIRQTNIIWVTMVFLQYCIKEVCFVLIPNSNTSRKVQLEEFVMVWINWKRINVHKIRVPYSVLCNIASFVAVLTSFAAFVFLNKGIVVGDRTAHAATIHIPQIFYFSLFYLFFSWPHFLLLCRSFLKTVFRRKVYFFCIIFISCLIVHLNTLVHPYLLADNRHYTFYIWNRFYGRYWLFRYLIVPVYVYSIYCFIVTLDLTRNFIFAITYIPCTIMVLIFQKMIELRYFLIPYLLYRLHKKYTTYWQLVLEFFYFLFLNYLTYDIFFSKDIYWPDFTYAQKLIW